MFQQKEFLIAISQLPNPQQLSILESKYTALILYNIAERCEKEGYINTEIISFYLDDNRQKFSINYNPTNTLPVLTDRGLQLIQN